MPDRDVGAEPAARDFVTAPLADESSGPASPITPRRVLVVDDHEPTAVGLARLLRVLGHDVLIVHDGRAALEHVVSFAPDLVLLDLGLPRMDGYEVLRQLRALTPNRHLTTVALTGYGAIDDRARVREAGFDHHLVKPVSFKAVTALLELAPDVPRAD